MGKKILLFAACSTLFSYFPVVWAAEEIYPNKPINIIIAMAPGGVLDTHAKIIGDRLAEVLGQPIIRVHKPGGGGSLAASFSARAKPDGYTLFLATSPNIVLIPIVKQVDYVLEDFIPLGIYNKGVVYFGVKSDSKWKTVKDFVDDAKQRSGQLKVGSFGKFTHSSFVIQVFSKLAGIKVPEVPYKSCSETVTAVLGGHIDGDFCTSFMGQAEAGAVRVLALADHERWEILPDVKTFKELGYPVALPLWYSFTVPHKTPKKVVDILGNGLQEVFKRHGKEIKEELKRLEGQGTFFNVQQSTQEFKKDYEITSKIVKELGIERGK
jgi:tripartite-type tricarboxylate transporter receptor subunit TctC